MRILQKLSVVAAASALAFVSPLSAHRMWMLPSATVLSGSEGWITVDAAVSNTLFVFEHRPLRLDGLVILGPGGRRLEPSGLHQGRLRSSFDLHLDAPGTYRISLVNANVLATWKRQGELQRWRGPLELLASEVPAGAEQLQVIRMSWRLDTFVTLGRPSRDVLAPTGSGLEIYPETHPNDLAAGEEASLMLLMDGKPAPGVELTVVQGGGRHSERPFEKKFVSGADGRIRLSLPVAGYYWIQASAGGPGTARQGSRSSCVLVLEVLPQ